MSRQCDPLRGYPVASRQPVLEALAFFGGGTGGHLFPGIALAERARERFPGVRAVFFRTSRAVEDRVLGGRGLEVISMQISPPGGGFRGWVRYAFEASKVQRAIGAALARGFDVAFGLGGYASLPGILAAKALGIPVVLLEQNRVPGKVNRLLAPFVDVVACACAEARFPLAGRREVTGNPLRREVIDGAARRSGRSSPCERKTVLVVGGSQGASGLNRAVRESLPALVEFREKIHWIHVAGDADKDVMMEAYRSHGWMAEVHAFTPQLPDLMARSDMVLGRAGGTTLSEIAVMGLPAVLVPYPYHKDNHQFLNARALVDAGAARIVEEPELNAGSLRAVFQEVLFAPEKLRAMGESARLFARPGAADALLDLSLELKGRCPRASASSS